MTLASPWTYDFTKHAPCRPVSELVRLPSRSRGRRSQGALGAWPRSGLLMRELGCDTEGEVLYSLL